MPAAQKQISRNREGRDHEDNDAAEAGYIARRFPQPRGSDDSGRVCGGTQGEEDAGIKGRRSASGHPLGNEAKREKQDCDHQQRDQCNRSGVMPKMVRMIRRWHLAARDQVSSAAVIFSVWLRVQTRQQRLLSSAGGR